MDFTITIHQAADDTKLPVTTSVNNTAAGLSVLAACTADVRQWYLQNGLQLNLQALIASTAS